jgi:hypothetical protein
MPIISMRGYVSKDGTMICSGPGSNCKVIWVPREASRLTKSHDDDLSRLTREYKRLLEPYLKGREDGRELRMFTTPDGDEMFVWAICVDDPSATELFKKYGSELTEPEEIRHALGLDSLG